MAPDNDPVFGVKLCVFALYDAGVSVCDFCARCIGELHVGVSHVCLCVLRIERVRMKKDGVCMQVSIKVRDSERPRMVFLCVHVGG